MARFMPEPEPMKCMVRTPDGEYFRAECLPTHDGFYNVRIQYASLPQSLRTAEMEANHELRSGLASIYARIPERDIVLLTNVQDA